MNKLSRRSFIALTASAAAGTNIYAVSAPAVAPRQGAVSLAGQWRFSLDREDVGLKEHWFSQELPSSDRIVLPGILQTQGFGDDIVAETPFVAALPRDMAWYKLPQYEPYTHPGNVKVPYLSQPVKHYLGVAWYQREIDIPADWIGKRVALTLERTRWRTTLFLDDAEIGSCQSLVAPHEYELGTVPAGKHRVSIRIDNRMILPYRPDAHSVSDAEGGTWNGIVGRIELAATSPVWLDDVQVFPNLANKAAVLRVTIGSLSGNPGSGVLSTGSTKKKVNWSNHRTEIRCEVSLPKAALWSEFSRVLQRLQISLVGDNAHHTREVTFGMREIRADGKQIRLNGELLHIRGTHDGGGFPLTGYPATDVDTWKRIIGICQQWGLNAIRFHSWCPPEAAFIAADQLGFYLQPDCGMWNSFDADGKMLAVLNDETARLLKAYGNHPSMLFLNATNEPAGHYKDQLPTWDRKWREADSRRLYADGTGRPAFPPPGQPYASDYLVTTWVPSGRRSGRGPSGWFGADYEETLHNAPLPCVGHEIGQWCAYPNFDVIPKFTGYMVPGNYEIWRDAARSHHLLTKNRELAYASGRLQVACYKEEIEASLRTASYSGYELLDLHDYLGQGGALVGVLDAFWESKSYVKPEEYRQFNDQTVLLARLKDRVYTTADSLSADVEMAHYGASPLKKARPVWKIADSQGQVHLNGEWNERDIPRGKNIPVGNITTPLAALPAPAQYRLIVELHGPKSCRNEWKFWVYSANVDTPTASDVFITSSWRDAEQRLAAGGKVLFTPDAAASSLPNPKLSTVPIFWNRLMNPKGTWFLGLFIQHRHPVLADFPTESYGEWQWIDLAADAHALNLNTLPDALDPIVQPIDDWNRSWKLGLLYECTVDKGKLMVCALDLNSSRVGAPTLRRSILNYMASARFQPAIPISMAELRNVYGSSVREGPDSESTSKTSSPDLVDPGQINRKRPPK